jgi:threonine synthase
MNSHQEPVPPVKASMGEGNTPLIEAVHPGHSLAGGKLFFKLESCNPTGSYKDRFIAAEVTRMLNCGAGACVATSSGNTGSSLAAYCARYDIRCLILVNEDAPSGKLIQMQAHGAKVVRIPAFVSNAEVTSSVFETLRRFSEDNHIPLIVSAFRYCPEGMRGVETIALELSLAVASLDHVFVPVGGGGLYSAIVQGFQAAGKTPPRVHAVQPEGCLTVVASYLRGDHKIRSVRSTTKVSGLSVPTDIDASRALNLLESSKGTGIPVSDEEVFNAQRILLEREGIYSEPAGAAAFAGWQRARRDGVVADGEISICLVTGHGFKDPASAEIAASRHPAVTVRPERVAAFLSELAEAAKP